VQISFRAKLMSIVLATMLALATTLGVRIWLGDSQTRNLDHLESRLIPKLEAGPRLESQFEHLRKGMQDAVAAQDAAALEDTLRQRNELIASISNAGAAISASDAALLRHAVTAYHEAAFSASRRMLRGESGEAMVDALAAMQAQQRATEDALKRATRLDRRELAGGFSVIRNAVSSATNYGIAIGVISLVLVLVLSVWAGRSVFTTLGDMSTGVSRYATGDFRQPIPITTDDEIGQVAREVNQMAKTLDESAWLKEGLADLAVELRAAPQPEDVARRAVTFLSGRIGAVAGTFYRAGEDGALTPVATYAGDGSPSAAPRAFATGQGLPGEAALCEGLMVVDDLPEDYLRVRSGLGEAKASTLLLLSLTRGKKNVGVVEFALFARSTDAIEEFLNAASETLAIAVEMAASRAALQGLLEESQRQTEQLASQEEELRASNRELSEQQEELRRANGELELQRRVLSEQNAELESARGRLTEKAAELAQVSIYKSQFLANMSHELRTPLNSMLLLSHLLSENEGQNLNEKQVEYAKTIHGAGKDLLGLINQVLDLAKIEAGRQDVVLEDMRIDELATNVRRLFGATAQEKGLTFRVELERGLPEWLTTDRQRLERILVNLLGNALKFTERGEVALRVFRPKSAVEVKAGTLRPDSALAFAVSDSGIGIAPDAQERIFAPFEQADARADRRYSGTGLGLAIARESAQLLGGDLLLESRQGEGSTFTCFVPERPRVGREADRAAPVAKQEHAAGDRTGIALSDPYLLVVEDDQIFAGQLVELIHTSRLEAIVATTGATALALARRRPPRGIILDVKLPDIDGWTVMERLRHDPVTRAIPVHFISSIDAPERALALGAVGYLTKPATRDELARVVRTLSRPLAKRGSEVLVVEDNLSEGGSVVALVRSAGFEARHVTSAADAVEALAAGGFGCVILDLGLPDMDGLGLLETLRMRPDLVIPPVVVHTGRSLTREESRRIEAYAEAVVLKDGNSAERLLDEVRLFLQHVKDEAPARVLRAEPGELLPNVSLEGIRILLADDDIRTVYALSALLRGRGAEIVVAETGREALDLLALNPDVGVVLMDIMMPELDGYEALRLMRADPRFKKLPAIALTAKAMKDEGERCLAAGATEYLAKPVDPGRLLQSLKRCLEGTRAQ